MFAFNRTRAAFAATLVAVFMVTATLVQSPDHTEKHSFIVQGQDLQAVQAAVATAGGEITHSLGIIRAVGARLSADQVAQLRQSGVVTRIYEDRELQTTSTCSVGAEPRLVFDKKKLSWAITNGGPTLRYPLEISI